MFRRLLLAPALRSSPLMRSTLHNQPLSYLRHSSSIQSVTQPSFWGSLVPKPLRRTSSPSNTVKKPKWTEWNPATFYIVIFLLIGSMSIQMIALRNDFAAFSRRADAKIDLLREVIKRVQDGEDVDVEGLLGTGNPEKEKEWEEALQEIENEEELWTQSRRKKLRLLTEVKRNGVPTEDENAEQGATNDATKQEAAKPRTNFNAPPGFY